MGLNQISGSTQIVFTVKSFFALIFALLGLFYGFYQLVVVPKVNATESHYSEMFKAQNDQNAATSQELIKINTSIGTLNGTVEALVRERATTPPVNNSGGQFSSSNNRNGGTSLNTNINGQNTASNAGGH
jgi:cell division protein FtsB